MIRIYFVVFLIIVLFIALRWVQRLPPEVLAKHLKKTGLVVLVILLVVLAGLGKLNWLFALVGVAVAFLARMMPMILRYAPTLQKLWFSYKAGKKGAGFNQGHQTTVNKEQMTVEEAYQVLGLKPGVSRQEIIDAYKRLIMKLHPDKGGSDFLAAQLNTAKEILLKQ